VAKAKGEPKGGDDAKDANLYSLDAIPMEKLVFDHTKIVQDYLLSRKNS
jgi:8-oxo-dGTP diphosphatase